VIHSAQLQGTVLGTLRLWASAAGVRRVSFESDPVLPPSDELLATGSPPDHLGEAIDALRRYLAGRLTEFSVPLDLHGVTPFQRRVYHRLLEIPYGHVVTYGRVAEDIGAEGGTRRERNGSGAARAVGQAVGANPIPILIPCHRVVGASGRLTGFGGGPERKATLLAIEGIDVDGELASSRVRPEVLRLPL
jgi:methylated-DNA-[protein]-cysteine S-methyltransferase